MSGAGFSFSGVCAFWAASSAAFRQNARILYTSPYFTIYAAVCAQGPVGTQSDSNRNIATFEVTVCLGTLQCEGYTIGAAL
jgi:hypothetical protein